METNAGSAQVESTTTELSSSDTSSGDSQSELNDTDQCFSDKSSSEASVSAISWKKVIIYSTFGVLFLASFALNIFNISNTGDQFDTGPSLWGVTFLLATIAIISVSTAFWLYYGRTLLLKEGPALVPEKWGEYLNRNTETLTTSQENVLRLTEEQFKNSELQLSQSEALMKSFLTLQDALERRDAEISRLQKGYDITIYKRFISRFIRLDKALNEITHEAKETSQFKNYRYLSRLMADALDECGVERLVPDLGEDYRQADKTVADDPKVIMATDPDLDFTIAEVNNDAYIVRGIESDAYEVIVQANVTIYRLGNEQANLEESEGELENE
jgi:hypothetical protein